jgi:hypothetical protein
MNEWRLPIESPEINKTVFGILCDAHIDGFVIPLGCVTVCSVCPEGQTEKRSDPTVFPHRSSYCPFCALTRRHRGAKSAQSSRKPGNIPLADQRSLQGLAGCDIANRFPLRPTLPSRMPRLWKFQFWPPIVFRSCPDARGPAREPFPREAGREVADDPGHIAHRGPLPHTSRPAHSIDFT